MVLRVQDLSCMKGDRLLFRGLALWAKPGMILRVAGGNGIGKSSLLRILAGLAAPEGGSIEWAGRPVEADRDGFRRCLFYLGHAAATHELLSPCENLRWACASAGEPQPDRNLHAALEQVGLEREMEMPLRMLSQGQRRRASLARLFLSAQRPLWLLDEPFVALDVEAVGRVVQAIQAHCARGGTTVLTTHQDVPFGLPVSCVDLGAYA
ncbi:MAG: cytochrome c biogenesis heme-transporting ATPase CcmA [Corticimicrobacter sp.]|uniref:cytochrome c biogenesis heme-transporting ATPase CcmA n=1 Tax=Corticimicrobacter sp. TaxID=2678536 RepID=UPI0032DA9F38